MNTSKEYVLGIDLGTSNSSVAIIEQQKSRIIKIDGSYLVPSVVSLNDEGTILVGKHAVNNQLVKPDQTISLIKRKMGKDEVIVFNGEQYTPPMISSLILSRLKLAAEAYCHCPISKAIITVPAYFNEEQREATQKAGELAGLEVLRLLNEPTSAALCYAFNRKEKEGLSLVYDLGGGTFDVSIVHIAPDVMEVKASCGDTALGGSDFDAMICEKVRRAFFDEHGVDFSNNPISKIRVMQAAENAKIRLSTEASARIHEEYIYQENGKDYHLKYTITRPEFEDMILPVLEKTMISVNKAIEEASCSVKDIDHVILVGGSTYIPLVAELLEKELKIVPKALIDPATVVVKGASIEAANLSGSKLGAMMVDITPHSLGVEVSDENYCPYNHIIIRRNTPLPVTASKIFHKIYISTDKIQVKVYQGESREIEGNKYLGQFSLNDIEDTGQSEILIKFELNRSGILSVTAIDLGSSVEFSKKMHRSQDSCTQRCDLGNVESVKIYVDEEAEDDDYEEDIDEEDINDEESILDSELEKRVQELMNKKTLDISDRVDLEVALENARNGEEGAISSLEDLVYYLS